MSKLWDIITKGREGKNIGIRTGWSKLDKVLGGIQPSRYYVIGAASSAGKTSFCIQLLYNILKQESEKKPIYFIYFSLEINQEILEAKIWALYCAEHFGVYLTLNDMMSFDTPISEINYGYLLEAKKWYDTVKQYLIVFDEGATANTIYNKTLVTAEQYGHFEEIDGKTKYIPENPNQMFIGFIDHLNLLRCQTGHSLKDEIDQTSSWLITLKKKLNMAWFALMQQNREASSMERRKADMNEPGINDLKDSSNPSQDADVVLQMFYPFREKLTSYRGYPIIGSDQISGYQRGFRSIITSKNRYGVADQVIPMAFYGSVGWFKELPKADSIQDHSIYYLQQDNIPNLSLQIKEEKTKDDSPRPETTKELIYSF